MPNLKWNQGEMQHFGALSADGIECHREAGTRAETFFVVGERSSGTNFLHALLDKNFALTPDMRYGWKHGFPHSVAYAPETIIFVSFREPYDWVRSMFAKPWHASEPLRELQFAEFLRHQWDTITFRPGHFNLPRKDPRRNRSLQLDRHPITGLPFKNLIQLRNVKNAAFLGLQNRGMNLVFVRHEFVRADPETFLHRVADHYDLDFSPPVEPVSKHLGNSFKRLVPGNFEAPKELSPEDQAFIEAELDPEIENAIGYR